MVNCHLFKRHQFLGTTVATVAAALLQSNAYATSSLLGCNTDGVASCSVLELVSGGQLIVNTLSFENWQIQNVDGTPPPDLSKIIVLPLDSDPLNSGLNFQANNELAVTGLAQMSLGLYFNAYVQDLPNSPLIYGASLSIDDYLIAGMGGLLGIRAQVGGLNSLSVEVDTLPPPALRLFDSTSYGPGGGAFTWLGATLFTPDTGYSIAANAYSIRFAQAIPEPSTPATLTLGLTVLSCIALGRRRLRREASQETLRK